MQKHLLVIWLFVVSTQPLIAQHVIQGKLTDSVNFSSMAFGSASLLRAEDSTLVAFAFTRQDGSFSLTTFEQGAFRLLITRSRFVDEEVILNLAGIDSSIQLGNIFMVSKANLLQEVIIKERTAAIRVKGDTTEFLVDSFLTNPNANVEDLLKKLPGIRVDKDGKITAQGREVKKVLVDGEEFFGNDPTVATRNIRADNVEKVQVFDQKSEQTNFTGIDDGNREKTINLQLKEDARKGYFGKVGTANGTEGRYEHEAMFNRFKNKQKFSVFGLGTNTNRTQLDWDEMQQYGGGYDMMFDDESGYFYSFMMSDDWGGGVGVPETFYTGAHFSDKWKDEHSTNFNYTRKLASARGFDDNYSTYILPDTLFYNNQFRRVRNQSDKHNITGRYEWKLDTLNTFRINLNYTVDDRTSQADLISENRNSNNTLVNRNTRLNASTALTENINAELAWMRKFALKGRSLSITSRIEQRVQNEDQLVQSTLNFFDSLSTPISTLRLDQLQLTRVNTRSVRLNTSYTEPLFKDIYALIDYQVSRTENQSSRTTNAIDNQNEYTRFVDSLSNDFKYLVWTHRGGLSFRHIGKKITAIAGGKLAFTQMEQTNRANDSIWVLPFINVFPAASISYRVKNTSSIQLRYDGSTQQPSVQQIQPLQDFSNPLLIRIGNPGLRQSFRNNFSLNYNSYKPISGRSTYASLSYNYIQDDFTSSEQVDEFGRRVIQTVNVNGNSTLFGYLYAGTIIKKLNMDVGLSTRPRYSTRYSFINNIINENIFYSYNINPNISKQIGDIFELSLEADWQNNINASSIRRDVPVQYWLSTYSADFRLNINERFELSSDIDYNVRQRTAEFDRNLNNTIWNASIKYRMLKSKTLHLSIEGYDLLNQQIGFQRTNSSNFINEHVYTVLQRYVLIRVVWNFTKGGVASNEL